MNMRDSIAAARLSGPEHQADTTVSFQFQFGASEPIFAGHFPGHPLLPGVFLLEMARMAAEWVFGGAMAVQEISKAKFLRPILPGEILKLELKCSEASGAVQARSLFTVDGQRAGEVLLSLG